MEFFEDFEEAIGRYAEGVCLLGAAASAEAIAACERRLAEQGRKLPPAVRDFLRRYDGATLFHEEVRLFDASTMAEQNAAGADDVEEVPADLVAVAESAAGDRYYVDADGRAFKLDGENGTLIMAATTFARLLGRFMALGKLLYDSEGEFVDAAFEGADEALSAKVRLRLARRAIAADQHAALGHDELGRVLLEMGRRNEAALAFAQAAELDAGAVWSAFDSARIRFEDGDFAAAELVFVEAARAPAERNPTAAFFYAWAAMAAEARGPDGAEAAVRYRAEVKERAPSFALAQVDAAKAALEQGQTDEASLLVRLALAVEPGHLAALSLRRSLPDFGV